MRTETRSSAGRMLSAVASIVTVCGLLGTPPAAAQLGQDAVYQAPNQITSSPAFIDASQFIGTGNNQSPTICGAIYGILSGNFYNYPASGAVIDARGVTGTNALTCVAGKTPWNNGIQFLNKPSTILLPSTTGSAQIVIPTTWVLPAKTRLVGAGESITAAGFTPGTTLQAHTSFSGTTMISFGQSSCSPCTGISVERLNLDGQGQSIDGIDNAFAQNNSYVDHVGLFRIRNTGLSISGNANNSGPYSNITFDLGSVAGTSSTVCASISGLKGTKGIHGLSCTSESNDPPVHFVPAA